MTNKTTMTKRDEQLLAIAKAELFELFTLDTRNSDDLDFYDVAVWNIKHMLEKAYDAGQLDAICAEERRNAQA